MTSKPIAPVSGSLGACGASTSRRSCFAAFAFAVSYTLTFPFFTVYCFSCAVDLGGSNLTSISVALTSKLFQHISLAIPFHAKHANVVLLAYFFAYFFAYFYPAIILQHFFKGSAA